MSSTELFRIYRSLPLDLVLQKLGAASDESGLRWQLRNGQALNIAGEPGSQTWKNEALADAKPQRGAIDLVVAVREFRGPGQALMWLKSQIPVEEASALVAQQPVRPVAPAQQRQDPRPPRQAYGAQPPSSEELGGGVRQEKAKFVRIPKETWDRYDSIRIDEVFERLGATLRNQKWNLDDKKFIVKDQRWQDVFNEEQKGGGAISLAMYLCNLPDRHAGLGWLLKEFGEAFGDDLIANTGPREIKDFSPPERIPEADAEVYKYLVEKRLLPAALITEVMKQGSVYGSHPWYEKEQRYITRVNRCVFLGPASAELRDTTPDGFKGCCDGSQTDGSGFSVRPDPHLNEKILAIGEAAIDALSYRAIFPGRTTFSPNGAGRFVLMMRIADEALNHGFGLRMSTDADLAGDIAAQKIFNALYCRKVLSKQLGFSEEQVAQWFIDGDLSFSVQKSPHQLFFNNGWQESLPVFKRVAGMGPADDLDDDDDAPETDEKPKWLDSGEVSPPCLTLRINKDLHERLRRGTVNINVSERGFRYITEVMNLKRDRPTLGKDWNDVLNALGMKYSLDYNRRAARGFADGAPELPPELEAFRSPVQAPVAATSSQAPHEGQAPADASPGARPRPIGMRR